MSETTAHKTALQWHNDHLELYDPALKAFRKINSLKEAQELMGQTKDPFVCVIASLYAFTLMAASCSSTDIRRLLKELDTKGAALKRRVRHCPQAVKMIDRLLIASRESLSVNGIKTDIYHEAIKLSIKTEEYYNKKRKEQSKLG